MQARVDWVLTIFGTQAIKKKRPVRSVFPDYLSVSYDYGHTIPLHRSPSQTLDQLDKSLESFNKLIRGMFKPKCFIVLITGDL